MEFSGGSSWSYSIDLDQQQLHGFAHGYPSRRHSYEFEADEGSQEARADWLKQIGPVQSPGGCNPFSGHFAALTLPTCKPERLRLVAYIFEYAFLHDNILESAEAPNDSVSEHWSTKKQDLQCKARLGLKQIQSKIKLLLLSEDPACAKVVIDSWKEMVQTTSNRDKSIPFKNIDEYIEYRIIDTGAPFVDKVMLFGMGLTLTEKDLRQTAPIIHPCYAALGLTNDYWSFDVEFEEYQRSGAKAMTNAVWLAMYWYNFDVVRAKAWVSEMVQKYENSFLNLKQEAWPNLPNHLRQYVEGLAFQVSGNALWSTDCPRYHNDKEIYQGDGDDWDRSLACYIQGSPQMSIMSSLSDILHREGSEKQRTDSLSATSDSTDTNYSADSEACSSQTSISESTSNELEGGDVSKTGPASSPIMEPYKYIDALPSKGVRDILVDALSIWLPVSPRENDCVKQLVRTLHNASLMFDDVEDTSILRRGKPATHTVFGVPQTINTAGFMVIQALKASSSLKGGLEAVVNGIEELYIGQSLDLYWTRSRHSPSEADYLDMVDKKTGGLFRIVARLLNLSSNNEVELGTIIYLLGTVFQVRDDYLNLKEYSEQKGFCDDLDEGKYSFPIIHALSTGCGQLEALLQSRQDGTRMPKAMKKLILEHIDAAGSFEYTTNWLQQKQGQLVEAIGRIENETQKENWMLRMLVAEMGI